MAALHSEQLLARTPPIARLPYKPTTLGPFAPTAAPTVPRQPASPR